MVELVSIKEERAELREQVAGMTLMVKKKEGEVKAANAKTEQVRKQSGILLEKASEDRRQLLQEKQKVVKEKEGVEKELDAVKLQLLSMKKAGLLRRMFKRYKKCK